MTEPLPDSVPVELGPLRAPARAAPSVRDWFTPGKFACLLALAILAAFPEVIFGSKTFFFRDFSCFGYPIAHYARECFWRGEVPLWNPYNNCGLPFLAQWNTMVLYPPMLFCYLLPLGWSLAVFNLAHLFLAGVGMYRLTSAWTNNRRAGCLAGIVFALNGLTLNCLMWPNNIGALGWMPWVILWVERGCRKGGRAVLLAALAGTFQMLTGAPEIILFTWLLCAGLVVVIAVRARSARLLIRFAFLVLLVTGLSAAQLFPFLELLLRSHRDSGFGASQWAMPGLGWVNLFVPLFQASPAMHGVYAQTGQFWTSSYYVGLLPLGLAGLGLIHARSRHTWLLAALVVLSLLLASGESGLVYPWLRKLVPQIGFMRFPIKLIVPAVFGLSLLAGHGAASITSVQDNPRRVQFYAIGFVGLAILVSGLALLHAYRHPAPGTDFTASAAAQGIRLLLLVLPATVIILRTFPDRLGTPSLARSAATDAAFWFVLLAFTAFDLLTHVPWQNPTVERAAYSPKLVEPFLPSGLEHAPAKGRAFLSPMLRDQLRFSFLEDPFQHVMSRRAALFNNCNLLDGVPKADGFYSLYPRELAQITSRIYLQTNMPSAAMLDLLAVAHVSDTAKAFDWEPRPNSLPLVSSGQRAVFMPRNAMWDAIWSPAFDPRNVLLVPEEARREPGADGRAAIAALSARANALEFTASSETPAWLSISRTWDPHWRAFVNGAESKLYPANHAFQALRVPAGESRIRLSYRDTTFAWGLVCSCFCGVLWFACWILHGTVSQKRTDLGGISF